MLSFFEVSFSNFEGIFSEGDSSLVLFKLVVIAESEFFHCFSFHLCIAGIYHQFGLKVTVMEGDWVIGREAGIGAKYETTPGHLITVGFAIFIGGVSCEVIFFTDFSFNNDDGWAIFGGGKEFRDGGEVRARDKHDFFDFGTEETCIE